jgi:hypothetical protein
MAIHRVKINASTDYVMGHLRYGHYEGLINLNDEEFKEFIENPTKFLSNGDFDLNFVVDDYRIEDIGEICDVEYNDLSAI